MASIDVPYLVPKPGRGGSVRYFWQPAAALRRLGWRAQRIPDHWQDLAGDPAALKAAAIAKAEALNAELRAWRRGTPPAAGGAAPARKGNAAIVVAPGTLASVIQLYKASPRWTDPTHRKALAANTRRTYLQSLDILERWGGAVPVRALSRKSVQALYETLYRRSPAVANRAVAMLRTLLAFALREGLAAVNVATDPDTTGLPPSGRIWPPAAVDLFVAVADRVGRWSIGTAVLINDWLGQRAADVLAMDRGILRRAERGQTRLMLQQAKTGAGVVLPIGMVERLTSRLEAELARQDERWGVPLPNVRRPLILSEATGAPWNGHTFRHEFAEIRAICAALCPSFAVDYLCVGADSAGEPELMTEDLLFMHLRHTAVVRLAEAGCSDPLISAITGHTLQSVKRILEHYLVRTGEMAAQAFAKRLAKEQADG